MSKYIIQNYFNVSKKKKKIINPLKYFYFLFFEKVHFHKRL